WLRKHDPDPPRFTIEVWPGATTRVECCLCAGFDWVCPACKIELDPVTYAPLRGGCNNCANNLALKPIRWGRVELNGDYPAPFLIGADRKLRAVCRGCVDRLAPSLENEWQAARRQRYHEQSGHSADLDDIPF